LFCLSLSCGITSRYMLDEESGLRTFVEELSSETNRLQDFHSSDTTLSWLPDIVKDFILPAEFPGYKH